MATYVYPSQTEDVREYSENREDPDFDAPRSQLRPRFPCATLPEGGRMKDIR